MQDCVINKQIRNLEINIVNNFNGVNGFASLIKPPVAY